MGHGKDREVKTCAGPVGCVVSDRSVASYKDDGRGMCFIAFPTFDFLLCKFRTLSQITTATRTTSVFL